MIQKGWQKDKHGNIKDENGNSVVLNGFALACGRDDGSSNDNTALALAAPALLEALEYCKELLLTYEFNRIDKEEIHDAAITKIDAAIAAAKGE